MTKLRSNDVSVPSRGILFPNDVAGYIEFIDEKEFPSPLGASYFQMEDMKYIEKITGEEFPSPLGASYFQIAKKFFDTCENIVSVPSRGILFPNTIWVLISQKFAIYSFRPLSGHLISKYLSMLLQTVTLVFPSPLGASYFQICKTSLVQPINRSFRPLSGHLISKYKETKTMARKRMVFPSPLGASYFQILKNC